MRGYQNHVGRLTGSLTINGATVPLRHAYASARPGFFDKKKEDIHILLSTVPLSDEATRDADVAKLTTILGKPPAYTDKGRQLASVQVRRYTSGRSATRPLCPLLQGSRIPTGGVRHV